MARRLKILLLWLGKWCGVFGVARRLTRRKVRILAYHGFALSDEARFRPKLFITEATFRRRMRHLATAGYPVLRLQAALDGLARGDLTDCPVVITIDDGFYGTARVAAGVLDELGLPATMYVTTYYAEKALPIFRLAVQYMFWKTERLSVDLADVDPALGGVADLTRPHARARATWTLIRFGEEQGSEGDRVRLARRLGVLLGVDFETLRNSRILSLLTADEIRALAGRGVDIQLHTHRHRSPSSLAELGREIEQNRRVLAALVDTDLRHLAYPGGEQGAVEEPWLVAHGIESAVMGARAPADPSGLNDSRTPRFALRRFSDGENVAQIEFEAELAGYTELLRQAAAALGGLGRRRSVDVPGGGAATGVERR